MSQPSDESRNTHYSRCEFEDLKTLYNLNTVAKEYAESAEKAYNVGLKRKARIHSQPKKALYGLKRVILGELIENGCVDNIRKHKIDGRTYYCVYAGEFSFHTPTLPNGMTNYEMRPNLPQSWTHLTPIQVIAPPICENEKH